MKVVMVGKAQILCMTVVFAFAVAAVRAESTGEIAGGGLDRHQQGGTSLSSPGDYDWWYGCSPTAAGMIVGHYDAAGYDGASYDNLIAGGVAENQTYTGSGPFIANDAIASDGHQADFYNAEYYGFDTGGGYDAGFTEYGDDLDETRLEFDCLADFMGTSQDAYDNINGATTFWYYTNGERLYDYDIEALGAEYFESSGMYGISEYLEYAGYGTTTLFNQYISGHNGNDEGFTFEEYMDEIDAGRGVMIQVAGHSMFGYGYDELTSKVLLHDTGTLGEHEMVWGDSYSGMEHYGVTVLEIVPEPMTLLLVGIGGLVLRRNKGRD